MVRREAVNPGYNILGTKLGQSKRIIVLGSHYDSMPQTPGADDNASGCALNLLLARELEPRTLKHTIVFAFFDAEENGLVGSRICAKSIKCDYMVNFDMVGHLSTQTSLPNLNPLFRKYPWSSAITFRGTGASDHTPFVLQGVPSIWLFTGDHPLYHTPEDTPKTLNYHGMVQVAQYAKDLIRLLDQDKTTFISRLQPYQPPGESR